MKRTVIFAMLVSAAPAFAAAADEPAARSDRDAENRIEVTGRRICTRIERRGASRMAQTRICLTADEWRERLGPDWRQELAGNSNLEDDMDSVDNRARAYSSVPTPSTPQ